MEWKKENISASELEKRRKEYMNAALGMMKRSHTDAVQTPAPRQEPSPRPAPSPRPEPVSLIKPEPVQEKVPEAKKESAAEKSGDTAGEKEPVVYETHENTVPAENGDVPESESRDAEKPEKKPENENVPEKKEDAAAYGVYTAEELLGAEPANDGLKKAAEILEEMTRNTAYMKKLANGSDDAGGDPDTTDFPEFSCDMGGEEDDGSFRAQEKAAQHGGQKENE